MGFTDNMKTITEGADRLRKTMEEINNNLASIKEISNSNFGVLNKNIIELNEGINNNFKMIDERIKNIENLIPKQ